MSAFYEQLAERIRGETPELERVAQRALFAWSAAAQSPGEDMFLDSVALNLHGFYSGVERLFELIARRIDLDLPDGQTWHRDLLRQMALDVPGVRPAVIDENTASSLDEYRRFRHLVRNVYTMNLVPTKMTSLMVRLPDLWSVLRAELLAFADFLDALAAVDPPVCRHS